MLLFVLYIGKCRAEKSDYDKTSSLYVQLINISVLLFIYELLNRKSSKLCSSSEIFAIITRDRFSENFLPAEFRTIDFSIRLFRGNTQRRITNWSTTARGVEGCSRGLINFLLKYLTSRLTEVPKRARRPFCELTREGINAPGAWDSFHNCCGAWTAESIRRFRSHLYTSAPLEAVKWKWISERLEYQSRDNMYAPYIYWLFLANTYTRLKYTALFKDTLSHD